MKPHRSNSRAQSDAEVAMLAAYFAVLGGEPGVHIERQVPTESGAVLDAVVTYVTSGAEDPPPGHRIGIEVYSRIGRAQGGQTKKAADDGLKLMAALARGEIDSAVWLTSPELKASITGWRASDLRQLGVSVETIALDGVDREVLLAGQILTSQAVRVEG